MSVLSQFATGGLKRVQRGIIIVPPGVTSATATILPVNMSKSFVSFLGSVSSTDANSPVTRISLESSTSISLSKNGTAGSSTGSYEVIEFY